MTFPPCARDGVRALANSKIREVANAGIGRAGVLPFWFGEPDDVTPAFIRAAAVASLDAGETFYAHNLGIPELRAALAAYTARLHGRCAVENIAVTNSGMNALMLCFQALIAPGDRVVAVTPLWPNLVEGPRILSADVHRVALDFDAHGGWRLDLGRLLAALTPATRVLIVNSPNNPTGWTLRRAEQEAILAHCRARGIWIIADDAYERMVFAGTVAPSFLDIAAPEDRVVSANTFSKSWLMTGWRLGWITGPAPLVEDIGKIIEYNTSCAQTFVQRAGVAAVTGGDAVTAGFVDRLRRARDFLHRALAGIDGIEAAVPPGAMYAFFRVRGMTDSLAFCKRLVAEHGLGVAPGIAFGPEGEGCVRWCFAAGEETLAEGVRRLARGLGR
ncbi:MAG: pyridoxal phosphate-dependent aminotransferase [Burkholderiales bacterium]|nr:pyridoxal phosphate-dependent aminotransferase [Burkholderiales bacterium]